MENFIAQEIERLSGAILEIEYGKAIATTMEVESETGIYIPDGNTVRTSKGGSQETLIQDKPKKGSAKKGSVDPEKFHTNSFKRLNDYAKCKEALNVATWVCAFTLMLEISMSIFSQATELTTLIEK
ncbi:hypothetical protein [Tritonibacter horizontis]|uniref:Uncharacterized protein n=1 Tax=Tritonibacter horizontis TaxID=1768241 RepID=A0A132BWV2_9RHOB|nr:hypothetical protein [Tritonibacter horizontis]KUP92869.1 hypothetical protein TRIHO_23200 [Tritonibacter horizontis]